MHFTPEISFSTSRSGGKGGQNVNKVETAVTGYFPVQDSRLLTDEQKTIIMEKLASRINSEAVLVVRSQVHRSQLENKEDVIRKIHSLLENALRPKKPRVATRKSRASVERRLESKKKRSETKGGRRKWKPE